MKKVFLFLIIALFIFACEDIGPQGPSGADGVTTVITNIGTVTDLVMGTLDSSGNCTVFNTNVDVDSIPCVDAYVFMPAGGGGAGWYDYSTCMLINNGIVQIYTGQPGLSGYQYRILIKK